MAEEKFKYGKPSDRLAARAPGPASKPQDDDDFPGDFAKAKLNVIRPELEKIAAALKERGHDVNISEDSYGTISIHIVPAGVDKSIHKYDWFPTLSFSGAAYTKTVVLQGRNARRNSEGSPSSRGDYKPAALSQELVEKEVMKFVGEIANWVVAAR